VVAAGPGVCCVNTDCGTCGRCINHRCGAPAC
jgi:hypothetical protein